MSGDIIPGFQMRAIRLDTDVQFRILKLYKFSIPLPQNYLK
jgi:hypothetical protein